MKDLRLSVAVCEYNPFHNGHKLHLDSMRQSKDDIVAVIMSGNFCQRGEPCLQNKFIRAKHAVLNGADIVFELPTVFAISPAEIFAGGAIKLLDSLPGEKTLYFGAEGGSEEDFFRLAHITSEETAQFKELLKQNLKKGHPYVLARNNALQSLYEDIDLSLLEKPNCILGIEYAKAILKNRSSMKIKVIKRDIDYNDLTLKGDLCSAAAIREAIQSGKKSKVRGFVPKLVYEDLPQSLPDFGKAMIFKAIETPLSDLKAVTDCTEGLENRIKAFSTATSDYRLFLDKLETRRYTRARLKRIMLANMLGIKKDLVQKCLKSNLYLKVLAIKEDKLDLLNRFSSAKHRLITRKTDERTLSGTQKACFLKDIYANDIYNLFSDERTNGYLMQIVKDK